jgi:thymidine kinase
MYTTSFPKKNINQKGEKVKKLRTHCIDCGSEAIQSIVDEIKPVFKMEIISFACGAELKTTYAANGKIGKAIHSGCMQN